MFETTTQFMWFATISTNHVFFIAITSFILKDLAQVFSSNTKPSGISTLDARLQLQVRTTKLDMFFSSKKRLEKTCHVDSFNFERHWKMAKWCQIERALSFWKSPQMYPVLLLTWKWPFPGNETCPNKAFGTLFMRYKLWFLLKYPH